MIKHGLNENILWLPAFDLSYQSTNPTASPSPPPHYASSSPALLTHNFKHRVINSCANASNLVPNKRRRPKRQPQTKYEARMDGRWNFTGRENCSIEHTFTNVMQWWKEKQVDSYWHSMKICVENLNIKYYVISFIIFKMENVHINWNIRNKVGICSSGFGMNELYLIFHTTYSCHSSLFFFMS